MKKPSVDGANPLTDFIVKLNKGQPIDGTFEE